MNVTSPRRLWKRYAAAAAVVVVAILATAEIAYHCGFRIVITESVPRGLYFLESGQSLASNRSGKLIEVSEPVPITRGRLVFACAPEPYADDAIARGILAGVSNRDCAGGAMPIVKRVEAVENDRVVATDVGVVVWTSAVTGCVMPRRGACSRFVPHSAP